MEKYYERITTILDKTQLIVKEIQLVSSVRSCCAQFCSLSVDDDWQLRKNVGSSSDFASSVSFTSPSTAVPMATSNRNRDSGSARNCVRSRATSRHRSLPAVFEVRR